VARNGGSWRNPSGRVPGLTPRFAEAPAVPVREPPAEALRVSGALAWLPCAAVALLLNVGLVALPPVAAADIFRATSAVTLHWTTPGDDGSIGVAARFDLRYSLEPITPQTFWFATLAPSLPTPDKPGTRQRVKVVGLEPNRVYYFALRTVDNAGNWSAMSNVLVKTAPDPARAPGQFPIALSAAFPNPSRGLTRVDLSLPREMVVHVNVIDVNGRVVKCLAEGPYPAGLTPLWWNLTRDRTGERIPSGQYWVSAVIGDRRFAHPLTVLP